MTAASLHLIGLVAAAAGVAALLAHGVARIVITLGGRLRLLDVPGPRSSHAVPTPRGGGVGIAVVGVICVGALAWVGLWLPGWMFTAGGLALVAIIGGADDLRSLPALLRLLAHLAAAILIVHAALLPWYMADTPWSVVALVVLALVASVNLHNFMDGIDSLLTLQAIWCGAVYAVLFALAAQPAPAMFALLLAAAASGFLPSNWPRARVFLGDGGSGYIGLAVGWLALVGWSMDAVTLPESLVIASAFLVDSGLTLGLRLLRRERIWQAHREHLYQHLAHASGSHLRVAAGYMAWNLVVALPVLVIGRILAPADGLDWPGAAGVLVLAALAWLVARRQVVPAAGIGSRR